MSFSGSDADIGMETVGLVAAVLTTASFLPQVIHTFRSRSTKDISLVMYSAFLSGVGLWVAYGFYFSLWPVVVANALTFILALFILSMKVWWEFIRPPPPQRNKAEDLEGGELSFVASPPKTRRLKDSQHPAVKELAENGSQIITPSDVGLVHSPSYASLLSNDEAENPTSSNSD
ncbi:MtN3 and saliva related transmembrane protein [Balamuthia mandrillaris]